MNCKPNSLAMVVRSFPFHDNAKGYSSALLGRPFKLRTLAPCGCCWTFEGEAISLDGQLRVPLFGWMDVRFVVKALPDEMLMPIDPPASMRDIDEAAPVPRETFDTEFAPRPQREHMR
jgi:hypothetical protein